MSSTTNYINSFSQNMGVVMQNQSNILAELTAIQQAMFRKDTSVSYVIVQPDGSDEKVFLPSYETVINRLEALESGMDSLTRGTGYVSFSDGTHRQVTLTTTPQPPMKIGNLSDPSTFDIDANWFFEDLMFPGVTVTVDLKGEIEDTADRVVVKRVILDAKDESATTAWMNEISGSDYDYQSLISYLSVNNVKYNEDEEILDLPLTQRTADGTFIVTDDPIYDNGKIWYQLDTLRYFTVTNVGVNTGMNNILSVGDFVTHEQCILKIVEINQTSNRVCLQYVTGVNPVGVNSVLRYYEDPFKEKKVKIRVGADEYDIIYFKGIAEAYNLKANEWSVPIKVATNELVSSQDFSLTLSAFYSASVVDWGAKMIAEAKQRDITAFQGVTPNTPVLSVSDLRVVQINTQINSALDTGEVKNLAAQIESCKSEINTLKSTIAALKSDLQNATTWEAYQKTQSQIETNTAQLDTIQSEYNSLVKSLQGLVKDNSAVDIDPKYHIRGFFPIPDPVETAKGQKQEIIGFDIAYRYIKEDNTGTQLNTFSYNDNGTMKTGVFSDWNFEQSVIRERFYNVATGLYEWVDEDPANGTEVNINQIDIPITKGERVEIMVRSVSEAGYPSNCLKSPWSGSVIVEFPANLSTSNEISDLIKETNDDVTQIAINNTLRSEGVIAHLSDTVPNTQSVTGMYYKHEAKNIAYEQRDTNNTDKVMSTSVQAVIDILFNEITNLKKELSELKK